MVSSYGLRDLVVSVKSEGKVVENRLRLELSVGWYPKGGGPETKTLEETVLKKGLGVQR